MVPEVWWRENPLWFWGFWGSKTLPIYFVGSSLAPPISQRRSVSSLNVLRSSGNMGLTLVNKTLLTSYFGSGDLKKRDWSWHLGSLYLKLSGCKDKKTGGKNELYVSLDILYIYTYPRGSMYGIFTYIWLTFMANAYLQDPLFLPTNDLRW